MGDSNKYLVVGQGLAGSVLLYQLEKQQIEFEVLDNNHKFSASMAAGGIMHPMSFRRLNFAWRALEFIDFATPFYQNIQNSLGEDFFTTSTFYRPFISIEEQNNWMARMQEPPFDEVLGIEDSEIKGISSPYGIGTVNHSGRMKVPDFLQLTKSKYSQRMTIGKFDFDQLKKEDESWSYQGKKYKGIIFCEGYQFIYNPYFNYLPRNLTKGEIVEIKTEALQGKTISRGCFIVPQNEEDSYLVGSTYRWNTVTDDTTEDAKKELEEKIEKVIQLPYQIYHQAAGVRPTITDRKPLIGEHPKHKGLFIFNGMGSKTVMMAPKLADQFAQFLQGEEAIYPEANILRHSKKYFHKFEAYEATKMSQL